MKPCDEAKEALERIDIRKSNKDRGQIAIVYRAHGEILEKLGFGDEAQLSYNKADELRYDQRLFVSIEWDVLNG